MPLKEQIQAIAGSLLTTNTFLYGTANEVNNKGDKAVRARPIIAMYPLQPFTSELTVTGSVRQEFNLYFEFLLIHNFGDDTGQCEPLIIEAIALHNQFLIALSKYRDLSGGRFFRIPKGYRFNGMPVYNRHDCNTCGVSLTMKVVKRYDDYLQICF